MPEDIVDEDCGIELYQMPVEAWSKRYYRISVTQGQEVYLVKRKTGNQWVVLTPGLHFGLINLAAKPSLLTDPVAGVPGSHARR